MRNWYSTPVKPINQAKVKYVKLNRPKVMPTYLDEYTDPCKKYRIVVDDVRFDSDKALEPRAVENLNKWLTKNLKKGNRWRSE